MRTDAPFPAVLLEVIDAWRSTRHPRLGDLADALSASFPPPVTLAASKKRADLAAWIACEQRDNPLDFPALMAAARGGSQDDVIAHVRALSARDDPRLARGLIALLEAPPYAGLKSRGMLQWIIDALEATRDPRVPLLARDLAGRYLEIVHSGTGGWVIDQLKALATRMDALPQSTLSAESMAECEAIEARLDPGIVEPLRAVSQRARAKASLDDLYRAVYAAPDDDAPRLVLADALLELGDPRGELIVLQVKRAREGGLATERELELLSDAKRLASWALPISNAGTCRFERGFPVMVTLFSKPSRGALFDPAWATVTDVEGLSKLPNVLAIDFLNAARNVRNAGHVRAAIVPRLAGIPLTSLAVVNPGELAPAALKELSSLRVLTLVDAPVPGFELPAQLEALWIRARRGSLPPNLFAATPTLRRLHLDIPLASLGNEPALPPSLEWFGMRVLAWEIPRPGAVRNLTDRLRTLASLEVVEIEIEGLRRAFDECAMMFRVGLERSKARTFILEVDGVDTATFERNAEGRFARVA